MVYDATEMRADKRDGVQSAFVAEHQDFFVLEKPGHAGVVVFGSADLERAHWPGQEGRNDETDGAQHGKQKAPEAGPDGQAVEELRPGDRGGIHPPRSDALIVSCSIVPAVHGSAVAGPGRGGGPAIA